MTEVRTQRRREAHNGVKLQDVAAHAGVSTATVSRALNDPESVSADPRARVLAAVAVLGYRPNAAARALAGNRTRIVGMVVPTIANSIFAPGIEAIEAVLEQNGYGLLIARSDYDLAHEALQVERLLRRGIDGLILVGTEHAEALNAALAGAQVPYVVQGAYEADGPHPCVGFDNFAAMRLIAEHVAALGHRRIAILSGISAGNDRVKARVAAIRAVFAGLGHPVADEAIVESRYDIAEARRAAAVLMARAKPSAILCVNDVLALGALFSARDAGIAVPAELSITGFDDFDIAAEIRPALTTIRVPVRAMGEGAARHLLARLAGKEVAHATLIGVELLPRQSAGPVASAQSSPSASATRQPRSTQSARNSWPP